MFIKTHVYVKNNTQLHKNHNQQQDSCKKIQTLLFTFHGLLKHVFEESDHAIIIK